DRNSSARVCTHCLAYSPFYGAADSLEPATCLDHAVAFAIAGKSRARLWFSSGRGSFVSGPAFSGLLAISLSGPCLGCHCKLATRQSAVQGPVLDVVWVTRISLLLASFTKQGRGT